MNAPAELSTAPSSPWLRVHQALGITMMDHLFNRLDGAYPHRWRSAFPTDQAIANWRESWAEAFDEEGIKPGDVKAGLRACRKLYDWPPSCAEFIKACRPAIDPVVAYYEALAGGQERAKGNMGEWSSPAVFWAYQAIGPFDLNNTPFTQLRPRWERILGEQVAKGEWPEIPEPSLALPAPGRAHTTREEASKRIAELGAIAVVKRPDVGSKAWAHRTLARTDVPAIAHQFAREALGTGQ